MLKKVMFLATVFFLAMNLMVATYAGAAPDKPIELTYAHFVPSVGLMGEQYQKWASLIEERTGHRVKIKFFWSNSLLSMTERLPGVASGVADIGQASAGYFPTQLPTALALEHPYNASDVWVGIRALSRLFQTNLEVQKEFERNGVKPIAPYSSGMFQLFTKAKWTGVGDLKGKVIRTMGGSRGLWLEKFGAKPMFMPISELYEAMERGVFWGFESNTTLSNDLKHQEVVNTVVLLNSGVVMSGSTIMNLKKFNSLPKDIQKIITDTGADWGENYMARTIHEKEEGIIKEWEKKGIAVVRPPAEDITMMKKLGRESAVELAKKQDSKLGTPGKTEKILNALWSEVDQAERDVKEKGYPWKR